MIEALAHAALVGLPVDRLLDGSHSERLALEAATERAWRLLGDRDLCRLAGPKIAFPAHLARFQRGELRANEIHVRFGRRRRRRGHAHACDIGRRHGGR